MTTPLPASSAGKIFHDGMATGKFHGVISPTTPTGWRVVHASLSPSSEGTIVTPGRPTLAGDERGHVDGLLHVAAGLDQHLAGLAGDEIGELVLVAGEDGAGRGDHLGPGRHGQAPPGPLGLGGGRDRGVDGGGVVHRVLADDVVGAGGVHGAEGRHGLPLCL